MHNMWNTINNNLLFMGQKQFYGLNTNQKRHFGYDFPNVGNIVVGKSFNNPNFVNKGHPKVHNYQRTDHLLHCQTGNNESISFDNSPFINSCQSIIENIKEKQLDIVKLVDTLNSGSSTETPEAKPIMCNKRTHKKRMRSKKSHSLKKIDKSMKNRKLEINEMMEVDMEPQNSISDISVSPMESHSLTLNDFLYNSFEDRNGVKTALIDGSAPQDLTHLISNSHSETDCTFKRERANSTAESEDSFIVFESGTDDELEFSDNSLEEEYEDSTDEDELDLSPSVVPRKKVSMCMFALHCFFKYVT